MNSMAAMGIFDPAMPLYLLYPAGTGEPEVLPQLLTEGLVLQAIERSVSETKEGA